MTPDEPSLFTEDLAVINLGLDDFARDLQEHGVNVVNVDWSPPAGGDPEQLEALGDLLDRESRINQANQQTLECFLEVEPTWVDVLPAREALPSLGDRELLHAGPSIDWDRMCGPQRRGVLGACVLEEWAGDFEEARQRVQAGELTINPTHEHNVVVPMATVVSPSMPLIVVEDPGTGTRVYSTLNEGRGEVQWFGVMNQAVLDHWRWIRSTLGPTLRKAVRCLDEKPRVFDWVSEGLLRGDECHVRAGATTGQLLQGITPGLFEADLDSGLASDVFEYIAGNTLFSLNFTMAACRVAANHAHGIEGSSVVTALSRNGVELGLRVGGLDDWITVPAPRMDEAIYYSGFGVEDSTGDIGDSSILEVFGLGGMAIASAPTVMDFVGGRLEDQFRKTDELRDITLGDHPDFKIPNLSQRGSPVGIDVRNVVETGITPFVDSGVIHETNWETGQIGAGIVNVPLEPFEQALVQLRDRLLTAA